MSEHLRALALAAKPWGFNNARQTPEQLREGEASFGWWDGYDYHPLGTVNTGIYFESKDALPVAEYVAAANPAAIIALLDELEDSHKAYELLFRENAELRKDAERYRWLREQSDDDFCFAVVKNPHFDVYETPQELDAAIDAAIDAAKGESHAD